MTPVILIVIGVDEKDSITKFYKENKAGLCMMERSLTSFRCVIVSSSILCPKTWTVF